MQYIVFDDMTQCTAETVRQLLPQVPDFRREQALKYQHTFGQFCCLQSWMMLQQLCLSSDFQLLPFDYNKYGKPFFAGGVEFSISHCKNAIAVAVNDTPVGIDVESVRQVDASLVKRTMNEEEQNQIAAASGPLRAFARLWTMKEAYLKYLGTGIIDDLSHCLDKADKSRFVVEEKDNYVLSVYC